MLTLPCARFRPRLQFNFSLLAVTLNIRQACSVLLVIMPSDFLSKSLPGLRMSDFPLSIIFMSLTTAPFLILFKTLPSISHLSFLSILCFFFACCCILFDFFVALPSGSGRRLEPLQSSFADLTSPHPMSFASIGPLLYCFGSTFNSLNIYNTLRFRRPDRGLRVANYSVLGAASLYLLFAAAGFAAYGERSERRWGASGIGSERRGERAARGASGDGSERKEEGFGLSMAEHFSVVHASPRPSTLARGRER
jgi:hypothetical protein